MFPMKFENSKFPMKFEVSQQQGISREKECAENGFTRTISFPSCELTIFVFILQERFYSFVEFHPQSDFCAQASVNSQNMENQQQKSEISVRIQYVYRASNF